MKLTVKSLSAAIIASTMMFPAVSAADEWPTETIELIVSYGAGGSTDTTARKIADILSSQTGESIVVQNFPGAGGTLGTTKAAGAPNDGNTLFLGQISSHGIAPAIYTSLQYDPVDSFEPIGRVYSVPNVLVVPASSPADTYEELLELAKSEKLTFASSGVGSSVHLSGELFKANTGLDIVHVPYKGSGEAIPALLGAQVDMMFDNAPSAIKHIQSGAVKALAVTTAERSPQLPDVPTIQEVGGASMSDFEVQAWFGMFAPKGISDEKVAEINKALNAVFETDDFRDFAVSRAATIDGGSPEDLRAHVANELAKWNDVVNTAGIPKK
ncbi:Bug family tripartite tricarboxylate transporter substrate binding protein [Hoeflea prorocentri]|uniref:Tripartite tricarboxylate transporter substrate binding protein n=1 Tax=Hoeflea prorocentri TaxID=1922333 RepID=A0A9X3ZG00_9HYPH|nr:tripartite tricarboxylate transporter substrate binding protein [Hoeflea prorocentri]MCY6379407.1 tripartite tricarboxylate transporter substrate binding protein [Hoeflea prorocentri]MDA5397208.1 tripartite tricarboxylate transporter substrate binding protein [Hoeflea prorocentri]